MILYVFHERLDTRLDEYAVLMFGTDLNFSLYDEYRDSSIDNIIPEDDELDRYLMINMYCDPVAEHAMDFYEC